MKVTPRFMIRAALVLTAGGVIGAFGACKDNTPVSPPPSPPPPPAAIPAPSGLTATAVGSNQINLAWTDNATNETGFRVDRCSGAGCTNFAQVGANLAVNSVAFSDMGLVASTPYSYRVRAFSATDTSGWTPTVSQTTGAAAATSITMIGAAQITTCSSLGTSATAALVQSQVSADPNTIVFTAGNNVASAPGAGSYSTCFDPTWGKFKDKMRATLGDADFTSVGGSDAVYGYFGNAAGAPKGYYSFDAGSWHVIVLNTTATGAGKCAWSQDAISRAGPPACASSATPELDWLADDLTKNTKPCLMAISYEHRLYTSDQGGMGRNSDLNAAAEMLYAAGLDILVSGKDQMYQRFPKLGVDGAADPKGFAEFNVGTGGRSLSAMHTPATGNPVAAQFGNTGGPDAGYGVIKFTLNDNSYGWEFLSTAQGGFSDKSTTPVACN